jgi:hypothetical protein
MKNLPYWLEYPKLTKQGDPKKILNSCYSLKTSGSQANNP